MPLQSVVLWSPKSRPSVPRFVYRGAQWDDIRRDVEATWNRCGLAYGATWAQVEAVVRDEWQRQDPIPARLIARE